MARRKRSRRQQFRQCVGDDADHLTEEQRDAWKQGLREAQRAWVEFKEHDCNGAVLYEWWGGAGGAISSCLLEHTQARTKDLRELYLDR
ncbi:MAG: lysozyme inhibitor LprI family protein [Methyloceanibacter sp.]|uniref:lysozyme inhibitor LprI family protein n=1 Tax=Methyloceanibacter sp. TaxID=1965321 RepID=UPI003D6CAEF8